MFYNPKLKVYFPHRYMRICSGSYFICEWGVNSYVNIISSSFELCYEWNKTFWYKWHMSYKYLSLLSSCISDAHWNLVLKHQTPVSTGVLMLQLWLCDSDVPYHTPIWILFEACHLPRLLVVCCGYLQT